jgi:hypothetical protein
VSQIDHKIYISVKLKLLPQVKNIYTKISTNIWKLDVDISMPYNLHPSQAIDLMTEELG